MAKALIIAKVKTETADRGRPDVDNEALSFVHCSNAYLPGDYQAFIVTGTAAQLLAVSNHPRFFIGQQITWVPPEGDNEGYWDLNKGRTAIAPGAIATINTYLNNNGLEPLTQGDNMETLIQRFNPNFKLEDYDVRDPTL